MKGVLGWDIGGVNTKAARVAGTRVVAMRAVPYEIQRDPAALAPLLARVAGELGGTPADANAVTMPAELSQIFRTKRDGVAFVVDAVTRAFSDGLVRVYAADGRWLTADEARREPLAIAAPPRAGPARPGARRSPHCILVRAASRELAGERLARVVCGDREILDEAAIDAIEQALWDAQVTRIAEAVGRVRRRHPGLGLAVVTGLGDFLAAEAARRAALRVTHLSAALGPAARHAPAAAAALLLAAELAAEPVTS